MQKYGRLKIMVVVLIICMLAICLCMKTGAECKANMLDREAALATTPFVSWPAVETELSQIEPEFPQLVSLGEFTLYHYCPCKTCTGDGDGITATGTVAAQGRTIATDWDMISPGTQVLIGTQWYVAEDSGRGITGKKIDIYMDSHRAALEAGVAKAEVFVLEMEDRRSSPDTEKEENEDANQ